MHLEKYKIPDESKNEFEKVMLKNNYNNMLFASIMLLACEIVLYTIKDKLFNVGNVILLFIIISVIFIPIIWLIRKKIETVPSIIAKIIQFAYCYVVLAFTIAIFIVTITHIDVSYVYVTAILAMSFFLSMSSFERIILLLPVFIVMVILIYSFQQNVDIAFVFIINMLLINFIAWGLGFFLRNLRKDFFLQKKMINEKNQLLEELVKKDSMTGLYNHNASFQKLQEEIDYSKRIGCPLSVIILDIDDFKKVNDSYGHLIGDEVLKKLSNIMRNCTRTTDTVGRYGGEEFIIILPDTDINGANILAHKIQKELSVTTFENAFSIKVSGGISQYSNETVVGLIKKTDEKLYKAKSSGKDRFL